MIRSKHKTALIKMMWDGTEITAGRVFGISNANQYLVELFREKSLNLDGARTQIPLKDGLNYGVSTIFKRLKDI